MNEQELKKNMELVTNDRINVREEGGSDTEELLDCRGRERWRG